MCWRSYELPVRQVAKKKIPVFKVLLAKEHFCSPVMNFRYDMGKLYSRDSLQIKKKTVALTYIYSYTQYEIHEGFHSYSADDCIYNDGGSVFCNHSLVGNYDSYLSGVRVDGYIPEGAEYYKNERGEIVSTAIILGNKPKSLIKKCVGVVKRLLNILH